MVLDHELFIKLMQKPNLLLSVLPAYQHATWENLLFTFDSNEIRKGAVGFMFVFRDHHQDGFVTSQTKL